ncbi:hypothetical protein AWJ20_1605 [Sugiyamaella lignohabitans]|uniref:Uncharacterized protein n=1 Tax=Sugiyamaella lignohabitans TaxID=796027 RepID=A0A167DUW3_9ASCO|nr:uncharacterized protein AWJ20_1605 [Sugiyamaella lignohabitans]ANB13319.1 hypothetical protein AWJ20_1605 [Sugiyamaella lignohabitans]
MLQDIDYFKENLAHVEGSGNSAEVIWENVNAMPAPEDESQIQSIEHTDPTPDKESAVEAIKVETMTDKDQVDDDNTDAVDGTRATDSAPKQYSIETENLESSSAKQDAVASESSELDMDAAQDSSNPKLAESEPEPEAQLDLPRTEPETAYGAEQEIRKEMNQLEAEENMEGEPKTKEESLDEPMTQAELKSEPRDDPEREPEPKLSASPNMETKANTEAEARAENEGKGETEPEVTVDSQGEVKPGTDGHDVGEPESIKEALESTGSTNADSEGHQNETAVSENQPATSPTEDKIISENSERPAEELKLKQDLKTPATPKKSKNKKKKNKKSSR